MPKTFICKNCHKEKPINIRLQGKQQYCGDPECQRARKAAWQRHKKASDAKYRARQQQGVMRWQKQNPRHRYMSQYRQDHPAYVEKNHNQQRLRNRKRRLQTLSPKIVTRDALLKQLEKATIYFMTPYQWDASQKIVTMDPLVVELKVFQGDRPAFLSTCP